MSVSKQFTNNHNLSENKEKVLLTIIDLYEDKKDDLELLDINIFEKSDLGIKFRYMQKIIVDLDELNFVNRKPYFEDVRKSITFPNFNNPHVRILKSSRNK